MDPFTWFILSLALNVGLSIAANILFSEDPSSKLKPSTEGEFNFPTSQESRAIPVIWGTVRIKGYNDLWHGDFRVQNITQKVKKNMFGNHKNVTVGYKYYLGFHYGWCVFAERLVQMRFGEKIIFGTGEGRGTGKYIVYGSFESPTRVIWMKYKYGNSTIIYNKSLSRWQLTDPEYGVIFSTPKSLNFYVAGSPCTYKTPSTDGWVVDNSLFGTIPPNIIVRSAWWVDLSVTVTAIVGIDITNNSQITIKHDNLFGGQDQAGGISGVMDIMFGKSDQQVNSYLYSKLANGGSIPVPAYRGMVSTVGRQMYIGNTSSLNTFDATMTRTTKDNYGNDIWYKEKAQITNSSGIAKFFEMNPIHIAYEIITDGIFALGKTNGIDEDNFISAADTCYSEGLGLSFIFDHSKNADIFLNELMGYIDGVIRIDEKTNKYQIKLIRDDFDKNDLDIIDESIISDVLSIKRNSPEEIPNQITITFTDPSTREPSSLIIQNTALIFATGTIINKDISAPAIQDVTAANKMGSRILNKLSVNAAEFEFTGNRKLANYNRGDPIRLSLPSFGFDDIVLRVIDINTGNGINKTVKVSAVQDVFKISDSIYSNQNNSYLKDIQEPIDITDKVIIELPYYVLVNDVYGDSSASILDSIAGKVGIACRSNVSSNTTFNTYIKLNGNDLYNLNTEYALFCGSCTTTEMIPISSVELNVEYENIDIDINEIDLQKENWCIIGDEIMKLIAFDTDANTIKLFRGCLDTLPQEHAAGSIIFFMSSAYSTSLDEFSTGQTIDIKITPSTTLGTLDLADATSSSITMDNRYIRPYNGANFKGDGYSNFTFTWEHRNRLTQTQEIVDQFATGIAPEPGTTYTFTVKKSGVPVHTETGITGTSASYSYAQRLADFGITITGTTSPDVTGDYAETGTNDGQVVLDNGIYAAWYSMANDKWYITPIADIGTPPVNGFENHQLFATFDPIGTATGNPVVGVGDGTATYHLKSIRDGYESWQEWSIEYLATPANMISETGDNLITETSDNIVTEAI